MTGSSRAEATRARLLEAAVTAFSEKGFHGTTTRDIAGAAGMSPAAVYVHHKSKEELLFLISREGHQSALDIIRAARATTADPVAQLAAVARAFAEFHAHHHTVARILNYELAALSEEHRASIDELRTGIDQELRTLVRDGVAAGVFDAPDPALAATALASMGVDIARWYREDGEWTPTQIGDYYADLALRLVGAAG
ncbi:MULTISPECIES: TetR/AcrR family transcriptional regulator [Pimelobacter]|uniref:TetR/AcrR family transcriptional regulator n=1 Tax=Pimelobacter TaxID=2044 RepID=UPI001C056C73|nr:MULTISPECIES: TetR/AcrR family transcriptional regulator [Pimelobacter]MBU2697888.1 TetR family transcriptional regulator [Pimelobacter sp. 30-1]UUW92459.1 TetR/AcrR family transcriptional regulator [Pimelobacter simplex]UUW96287.1 TetR/AcrR family transcriptional regulator [Pimelobacter simplex]